jgi:two-component system, NarL family, nitrate/nitrite response regulator NarL
MVGIADERRDRDPPNYGAEPVVLVGTPRSTSTASDFARNQAVHRGRREGGAPVPDIRLIIAGSVRLVRESLAANLRVRDGLAVCDAVDLSPRGVAKIADAKPDVVLVDVGQIDGAAAGRLIKRIKAANPRAKLVAFGLDQIDDRVFACAAAGFSGYVSSDSDAEELHRALIDAMGGRLHCAPHMVAAIFDRLAGLSRERSGRGALSALTLRENEILMLVAQGRSNKEIARQLAISSATVKNHMHSILQKLRVSRRGQAVARLRSPR